MRSACAGVSERETEGGAVCVVRDDFLEFVLPCVCVVSVCV